MQVGSPRVLVALSRGQLQHAREVWGQHAAGLLLPVLKLQWQVHYCVRDALIAAVAEGLCRWGVGIHALGGKMGLVSG